MNRLIAFEAGRLYEVTRHCKENFSSVYDKILSKADIDCNIKVSRRSVKDFVYEPSYIIDILLLDINSLLIKQGKNYRLYCENRFIYFTIKAYKVSYSSIAQ